MVFSSLSAQSHRKNPCPSPPDEWFKGPFQGTGNLWNGFKGQDVSPFVQGVEGEESFARSSINDPVSRADLAGPVFVNFPDKDFVVYEAQKGGVKSKGEIDLPFAYLVKAKISVFIDKSGFRIECLSRVGGKDFPKDPFPISKVERKKALIKQIDSPGKLFP